MSVNFGNLLLATAVISALATTGRAAPVINEIDPNQVGSVDSQEFIELAGMPLSSLNGYVVVLFNTLQNGADAVALYAANGSDFPNGTGLTTTNLVDAIVYGNNNPVDNTLLTGLGQSTQYNEAGPPTNNADIVSISRVPGVTGNFALATPTPMNSGIPGGPEPASMLIAAEMALAGQLLRRPKA